ncbi:MAG: MBL fold metallo-hydrolase [Phycisphaerales bacterium]|nr:MBL fold metallo-hydrolase [Phycisphaerales bacterium]
MSEKREMRWRWRLLDAGPLLLDGGSMFGVVPRVVWSRTVGADDRNRIALHHNCLLLESESVDPSLGRVRRVVVEAGTGDKLDAKMAEIFGTGARTVETAVNDAGLDCAEIDTVFVTHLHFDHAGGLTRRARSGEVPDWRAGPGEASGDCAEVMRTFPNAEVVVQRREWEVALANDAVMTRTYYRDHLLPIADRVRLADSARPFPTGVLPHRDETPRVPLSYRETTVLPGIGVFLAPGHTWGQQAIRFVDVDGRSVVFTPDVMPSVWHVGAAYSLAYDVEPYTSMVTKRWFLEEAARGEWTLVLDHEPRTPVVRAAANGKGWYDLTPVEGFGR